jgi:hypothetical protein
MNRHAYDQMLAPISKSMPHLNWSGVAFLSLLLPLIFTAMIYLVIGIKALCKKRECKNKLAHHANTHSSDFFKRELAEILNTETNNVDISNKIIEFL